MARAEELPMSAAAVGVSGLLPKLIQGDPSPCLSFYKGKHRLRRAKREVIQFNSRWSARSDCWVCAVLLFRPLYGAEPRCDSRRSRRASLKIAEFYSAYADR